MAYRRLTRAELLATVGQFLAQPTVKRRPLRNTVVTILTIHGATRDL